MAEMRQQSAQAKKVQWCGKNKVITLANHKGRRQSNEPIKTRSNFM